VIYDFFNFEFKDQNIKKQQSYGNIEIKTSMQDIRPLVLLNTDIFWRIHRWFKNIDTSLTSLMIVHTTIYIYIYIYYKISIFNNQTFFPLILYRYL
jgi:hypothetical protein